MVMQRTDTWSEAFAARARVDLGGDIASILALGNATDIVSFGGGFPDPATFPGPPLAEILRELADSGDTSAFQYAGTPGLPGLRAYLRHRLEWLEGLEPQEDELLVTSGGIEGLELLGKTFLDPGDLAVVEAPTYLGGIMAFKSFEASVAGMPIDDEGLKVDVLEDLLRAGGRPKLVYTIPDHQNPAGVSLSEERRRDLVELARRYRFLVVEDVAYRELGFGGERPASLWSMAPDVVVQVGTFSKTFFPGVRLGWAAGPRDVVRQLTVAKQLTDQCAGPLGQRLLEEYGRRGLLDAQVARARELYGRRCRSMLSALERHMPVEAVTWTRPSGGFFCWLTLPRGADAASLARRAMDEHRVAYVPGSPFFPDGSGRNTLRLAFSRVEDGQIEEGVLRLARLFSSSLLEDR